ncbi:MAG: tetratricopeptide repeat protein, partial [Pseudomonadota bacterium]
MSPLLGAATRPPPRDLEDLCKALLEGVVSPQDAASRWEAASALVEAYPDQEAPQLTAAQLLELRRDGQTLLETWSALHRRFPQNRLALRMALRWMGRVGRQSEGAALLDAACLKPATTAEELVEEAELWVELKDHTQAALRFETALSKAPKAVKPRLAYARALHTRGRVWEAGRVLAGLPKGARLSESAKSTCEAITQAVKAARAVPQTYDSGDAVPSVALHSAISLFANRALPPRVGSALGGVILLTGSLGSGGAERQLTRLAIALHKSAQAARPVAGIRLAGDVEVVVSHTDQARGKNFFRKDLEEAGVPLHLLREQPAVDFDGLGLSDPTLEKLAPILPQQTRFGLHRLVPLLRARKPEVV